MTKVFQLLAFLWETYTPEFFQDLVLELSEDDVRQGNGGVVTEDDKYM